MPESFVPPCPEDLLRKLIPTPTRFVQAGASAIEPGTVWEVVAPDGEVLLVLIVKRFDEMQAGPFPIVRAIPLSDFVRLTDAGDTIVEVAPGAMILAAHCWLEGPVLPEAFVRSIGSASSSSIEAVEKARAQSIAGTSNPAIASFRESLFQQFDPLFTASWEKLYACLDEERRTEEVEDASGGRPVKGRELPADERGISYALAAGNTGPSDAVIDKLASVSAEGASAVDYRRAWAHFLASTYRGTSKSDEWRNAFVAIASKDVSLDSDWMERVTKAKALTEDRDWKRSYEGEKVFALEPVPLKDKSDFLKRLAELAGFEAAD